MSCLKNYIYTHCIQNLPSEKLSYCEPCTGLLMGEMVVVELLVLHLAARDAGEDGTESIVQSMWLLSKERVF